MKSIFAGFVLLCCTACTSPSVTARTFYTSRNDLASYVLDTPDPDKASMGLGQVIWVRWMAPQVDSGTYIESTLRFKNESERTNTYPIDSKYGTLMIEVPAAEHKEKGDILSYKILLRHNEEILATTQHKLWVEPVIIQDSDS